MALTNQKNDFTFLINPNKLKPDNILDNYKTFLKILTSLISGTKEQSLYEDDCRALFGIQAYILFTLDKVILNLTKNVMIILIFYNYK